MPAKKIRRPTKEMMLAVNAVIDGDEKEAERLVSEHKLDRKELQIRLRKRGGEKYTFERKPRATRAASTVGAAPPAAPLLDGRTKTVTLLRLARRIKELLAARDPKEVAKVRQAVDTYEQKRRELAEMENVLGL